MYSIITKTNLNTVQEENGIRLIGKAEWHLNYDDRDMVINHSHVTVTFSKVGPIEAMKVFKEIAGIKRCDFEDNKEYYVFNKNCVKVHVNDDTSYKHFKKAIRHLFGFAVSELAEKGIKVIIDVTE